MSETNVGCGERAHLQPQAADQVEPPREQRSVHCPDRAPCQAAADRREREATPAAHGRTVREVRKAVHPVLGRPADIVQVDRTRDDQRVGRIHFRTDERDIVGERAPVFSVIEARTASPARADVAVGEKKGLELDGHAPRGRESLHPCLDHADAPGGVAVPPTAANQREDVQVSDLPAFGCACAASACRKPRTSPRNFRPFAGCPILSYRQSRALGMPAAVSRNSVGL